MVRILIFNSYHPCSKSSFAPYLPLFLRRLLVIICRRAACGFWRLQEHFQDCDHCQFEPLLEPAVEKRELLGLENRSAARLGFSTHDCGNHYMSIEEGDSGVYT